MPGPSWEDLGDFFEPDEFATLAIIRRGSETVAEVLGIFTDPNQLATLGEYEGDLDSPVFVCAEEAVVGVRYLDTAEIEGTTYDVMREPQKDGTGVATLILGEQTNVVTNAGL